MLKGELGLKKNCPFPISYRPCPITCYSKVFSEVLEILEKISPKHTFISNLASHYHVFYYLECTFINQFSSQMVKQHT